MGGGGSWRNRTVHRIDEVGNRLAMQPLDFRDLAIAKAHVLIGSKFAPMGALLAAQIVAVLVADHQQLHA